MYLVCISKAFHRVLINNNNKQIQFLFLICCICALHITAVVTCTSNRIFSSICHCLHNLWLPMDTNYSCKLMADQSFSMYIWCATVHNNNKSSYYYCNSLSNVNLTQIWLQTHRRWQLVVVAAVADSVQTPMFHHQTWCWLRLAD